MVRTDSWRGRIALMAGHCAGMIDLVALPVWVGALIAHYGFDPQQAGGLVTLFLAGADRGYGVAQITGVLIALGFVNLLPAPLAAWLQHRLPARGVLIAGPLVQAAVCALIMTRSSFQVYAAAACVFAAIIIFTHTFAFGLLARLEPSGRALAATPAMLMVGVAIGPILGGTFVKFAGYGAIAVVAAGLGLGAAVAVAALVPAQARQAHVARRAA